MRELKFTKPTRTHAVGLKPKPKPISAKEELPKNSMWDSMLANKKAALPTTGFNLVGCDDFELPGEQLYVISNHATREEAEHAQSEYKTQHPDETTYVYSPED